MKRTYKISLKDQLLATITIEDNARVLAWGDEEVEFGDYLMGTLLLNAQDDMIDLSYVVYKEEEK
jgi:hypothetical protein